MYDIIFSPANPIFLYRKNTILDNGVFSYPHFYLLVLFIFIMMMSMNNHTCQNKKCGYKWEGRKKNPKSCPRCKQYIKK